MEFQLRDRLRFQRFVELPAEASRARAGKDRQQPPSLLFRLVRVRTAAHTLSSSVYREMQRFPAGYFVFLLKTLKPFCSF
jgi:hypothetical protein